MNPQSEVHRHKSPKGWRRLKDSPAKIPILMLAFLLGFIGDALHWGRAPVVAVIAMTLPILGFRDFWNEARFWITVVLLGTAQVPIAIAVGPLMEQLKFPFIVAFGIFDCVLVALAISWVCSQHNGKSV